MLENQRLRLMPEERTCMPALKYMTDKGLMETKRVVVYWDPVINRYFGARIDEDGKIRYTLPFNFSSDIPMDWLIPMEPELDEKP